MKQFLFSRRILLDRDQDLEEVKEFLKTTLSSTMDITDISPGVQQFTAQGTTGSVFDFVRRAHVNTDFTLVQEETKSGKELRIFVNGTSHITYSLILVYLALFLFIMAVGLLPGSIETSGKDSDALDALVFLLIGLYIKTDIDSGLKDAKDTIENAMDVLVTRFGV